MWRNLIGPPQLQPPSAFFASSSLSPTTQENTKERDKEREGEKEEEKKTKRETKKEREREHREDLAILTAKFMSRRLISLVTAGQSRPAPPLLGLRKRRYGACVSETPSPDVSQKGRGVSREKEKERELSHTREDRSLTSESGNEDGWGSDISGDEKEDEQENEEGWGEGWNQERVKENEGNERTEPSPSRKQIIDGKGGGRWEIE